MKFIIKRYLLVIASLFILAQLIPAIKISNSWQGLFYASFVFSIIFYILKPIINLVMFPINLLTLNLSSWLIQVVIFYLWTVITNNVSIANWQFLGINWGPITLSSFNLVKWQVIIVGAVVYIFISKLLHWLFK